MSLTFDAIRHEYHWNDKLVPGVTSVLDGLHSLAGVPWEVLQAARKRGTHVHLACELYDLAELDEEHLVAKLPYIAGYLQGWKQFIRECAPNWRVIEQPFYNQQYGYAGTPDREGTFTWGREQIDGATIDIKSGEVPHPTWGLQTAAYSHGLKRPGNRRFTVQLQAEGTFRLIEWTDPADWPTFVALLSIRTFKEKHKL